MREELNQICSTIERQQLPKDFLDLFSDIWLPGENRFQTQETFILDFKDKHPVKFNDSYGSGVVKLALSFHNTYGGIITFGVNDRQLDICGVSEPFEIEFFNRFLSDLTEVSIECLMKTYIVPSSDKMISVVLVPQRKATKPVRLAHSLFKYPIGQIWVRDRHECVEPKPLHLPLLFSERSLRDSEGVETGIQRSIPPSSSTIKDFIGRGALMEALWDWLVFGDSPRAYLCGHGGSGKTTLAHEFATHVAENGATIKLDNGERLDCVIYLSAKQTEFNPILLKQQDFILCNFSNSNEQFKQILLHSGFLNHDDSESKSPAEIRQLLSELFNNFNMLVILDDIDALSRKKEDTGEEFLFLKTAQSKCRVKILYTARYPAMYALQNSISIPGLRLEDEFEPFVSTCCKQFIVPNPNEIELKSIYEATDGLPLIIETVIGLRKFVSSYDDALKQYKERGGSQARKYLYQREYDQLDKNGKSKYLLASLLLLEKPVSTGTLQTLLYENSAEQIRDSITECSGIFLTTYDADEGGETLYQLSPPAAPYVGEVSCVLPFFETLKRKIEHFKTEGSRSNPEEAAIISKLSSMLNVNDFQGIILEDARISKSDILRVNPQIRALLGRGYSLMSSKYREIAREHFRAAESSNLRNIPMMRNWYHMEIATRYNIREAERICKKVLSFPGLSQRYESEFYAKLGYCHFFNSIAFQATDHEKCLQELMRSIDLYLLALQIRSKIGADISTTLSQLDKPLYKFLTIAGTDVSRRFSLIEFVIDRKKELHATAAELILSYILRFPAPNTKAARDQINQICNRLSGKAKKLSRTMTVADGYNLLADNLDILRSELVKKSI